MKESRKKDEATLGTLKGGESGYKTANFILHMWIKSLSLKSAQKCPCSNYTLLAQAGVLGLYSDTLVPRSAQPVPDWLQVAFVPALIPRQRGLMGSWLPSCSPEFLLEQISVWQRLRLGQV
ncbi:Protocadherin gamma-A4 [Clarias magur]|uniref:Protocadherin gamma-A4 n=1 Tax=Clarias magur TaxID=1594786 RepID=A0A8J4TXF8_CLAMG|nr:Protocadherin gamma-A4 [Clarias magur]